MLPNRYLPIRCVILNNKAILTSVYQKRKRLIAPGQIPETPPRLRCLTLGLNIRFDAFDFTNFYGDVTTKTLFHTLFTVFPPMLSSPFSVCFTEGRSLYDGSGNT